VSSPKIEALLEKLSLFFSNRASPEKMLPLFSGHSLCGKNKGSIFLTEALSEN
jgi:hypothetical protein